MSERAEQEDQDAGIGLQEEVWRRRGVEPVAVWDGSHFVVISDPSALHTGDILFRLVSGGTERRSDTPSASAGPADNDQPGRPVSPDNARRANLPELIEELIRRLTTLPVDDSLPIVKLGPLYDAIIGYRTRRARHLYEQEFGETT